MSEQTRRETRDLSERSFDFCSIVYPEDLKAQSIDEFLTQLNLKGLQGSLSPKHSPDKVQYNEDGEINDDHREHIPKEHYHLFVHFEGRRGLKGVIAILEQFGINYHLPETCKNKRAYLRYMLHIGYPEKEQFNVMSLIDFGGFKSQPYIEDESGLQKRVFSFINLYGVLNLRWLVDLLIEHEQYDLLAYVQKNAFFVNSYLKLYKERKQVEYVIQPEGVDIYREVKFV